jgi:hypothetical protein
MTKSAGRDAQEVSATKTEVIAAIESLSAEDFHRLKRAAIYRIRGLGRAAQLREYGELLNEAVVSTLKGSDGGAEGRKWAKNRVPFVKHLFGAMRSIASHWKETYERSGAAAEQSEWFLASEDEEGKIVRPTERLADEATDPYRSRAAQELLDALDKRFAGDDDALLVIEGRKEGMTPSEMVAELGLEPRRVNAAHQRIRYFMERLF